MNDAPLPPQSVTEKIGGQRAMLVFIFVLWIIGIVGALVERMPM